MYVKVRAYSKINLFLEVLGKRSDGYHEVQMIMQMLRLWDNVSIFPAKQNWIVTDSEYVPNNRSNLAMKAAELMQETYNLPQVKISINKNIPISAGMAGGSSNAAAVLLGMRELYKKDISDEELLELGAKLGSDVPFCIKGPTAHAYGRGEKLIDLPSPNRLYVIVIKADFGVSTSKIYEHYKMPVNKGVSDFDLYKKALEEKNQLYLLSNLMNDLERTTFSLYPSVEDVKQDLLDRGIRYTLMSGSGPTVFALFETAREAFIEFKHLKSTYPNMILTSTLMPDDLKNRVFTIQT